MANSLRDLRRKMRAVRSTRQVTKAMELVAASKMRRAVQNAVQLRRYAGMGWDLLERIAEVSPLTHPYLAERPLKNVLAILFTSDRGLLGSLHTQLFRAVNAYAEGLEKLPSFEKVEFIAVGRKGQQFLARSQKHIAAAFPALSNNPSFRDALPIVRMATEGFLSGAYSHVTVIYADFVSAIAQAPTVRTVLPFRPGELQEVLQSLAQTRRNHPTSLRGAELRGAGKLKTNNEGTSVKEYLFEPHPRAVLDAILPQLTEVQVYQAVLEAAASEHSARMVAMHSATENASDLLDDLSLTYNQTRQGIITAELAELSASAAALAT